MSDTAPLSVRASGDVAACSLLSLLCAALAADLSEASLSQRLPEYPISYSLDLLCARAARALGAAAARSACSHHGAVCTAAWLLWPLLPRGGRQRYGHHDTAGERGENTREGGAEGARRADDSREEAANSQWDGRTAAARQARDGKLRIDAVECRHNQPLPWNDSDRRDKTHKMPRLRRQFCLRRFQNLFAVRVVRRPQCSSDSSVRE